MAELREEVARRLASMQWAGLRDTEEVVAKMEIDAAQGPGTTWGDLADEVIRIAEWARRIPTDKATTIPPFNEEIEVLRPLTLPPHDWKP